MNTLNSLVSQASIILLFIKKGLEMAIDWVMVQFSIQQLLNKPTLLNDTDAAAGSYVWVSWFYVYDFYDEFLQACS